MENKEKIIKEHWKKKNVLTSGEKNHAKIKANAKEKLKHLGTVEAQETHYIIQSLKDTKYL